MRPKQWAELAKAYSLSPHKDVKVFFEPTGMKPRQPFDFRVTLKINNNATIVA